MSIWQKIFGRKAESNTLKEYYFEADEVSGKTIENFSSLGTDNRIRQIMILGDSANLKYFPLLKFAI